VQEKLRIVLETLEPGVSVPVVARRHSVNANQLFIWRSQHRRGELNSRTDGDRSARLLPVEVQPPVAQKAEIGTGSESEPEPVGCMEIQFPGGEREAGSMRSRFGYSFASCRGRAEFACGRADLVGRGLY